MSSSSSNSTESISGIDIDQSSVSTISPVTWRLVTNTKALVGGKKYFHRRMNLFGEPEYVEGVLTKTFTEVNVVFNHFDTHNVTRIGYTMDGIDVADNIWVSIPSKPSIGGGGGGGCGCGGKEVTWRKVLNYALLASGNECYYQTINLFDEPEYVKGVLTITEHSETIVQHHCLTELVCWKRYTINGNEVTDNIWLPTLIPTPIPTPTPTPIPTPSQPSIKEAMLGNIVYYALLASGIVYYNTR